MKAFAAFRLASQSFASTSVSDAASVSDRVRTARAEAAASLKRICEETKLAAGLACSELLRLLPRVEKFSREGCNPRIVGGRVAVEWLELKQARGLVEIFFYWEDFHGQF